MVFIFMQWHEQSIIYNLLDNFLERELVQDMVEGQERDMAEVLVVE